MDSLTLALLLALSFNVFSVRVPFYVTSVSSKICGHKLLLADTRTALAFCFQGRRVQCYSSEVTAAILQKNEENPVMIYSKTWCPFCTSMKSLFIDTLKVDAKFAELDQLADGAVIQDELLNITGSRTVPQVFISGKYIGGASETNELHAAGGLLPLLDAAGVAYSK